jgi:tRNA modification GTPase
MFSSSNDRSTIFAPASGIGRAAVGVIRMSGPASAAAIRALTGGGPPAPRRASLKALRDPLTGEEIDRGLVLWFPAPHSYTGEDAAELQVTGGRAVLAGVLKALSSIEGLRPAEPGEFAWRAFENRKLDLSQVEGLADLVDAQTQAQRRQALRIAGGALSREADEARGMILDAMARIEAALDFSDQEDVGDGTLAEARERAGAAATRLSARLRQGERGERLREGFNVVIAGPPNVGKSTLLNALAQRDVAIVSAIPGTTRDSLEVHLELRGLPVTLIDTAGLRDTNDPIEREGVERARRRAAEADLILWLIDGTEQREDFAALSQGAERRSDAGNAALAGLLGFARNGGLGDEPRSDAAGEGAAAGPPFLAVTTKADMGGAAATGIAISAKTGEGVPRLLDAIAEAAEEGLAGADQALVVSARHRAAFEEAFAHLRRAMESADLAPEFFAEDLRLAARALERIAGRIDVEDILGEIFGRLCIGK